jgi:hypothetical protein
LRTVVLLLRQASHVSGATQRNPMREIKLALLLNMKSDA